MKLELLSMWMFVEKSKQSKDSCQSKIIDEMKWFWEYNLVLFCLNNTQSYQQQYHWAWCSMHKHFNAVLLYPKSTYIEIFLLCEKQISIVVWSSIAYIYFFHSVFCSSHSFTWKWSDPNVKRANKLEWNMSNGIEAAPYKNANRGRQKKFTNNNGNMYRTNGIVIWLHGPK